MTRAKPVASPCNGACELNVRMQWCSGCGRSLEEISAWTETPNPQRRAILARLPLRRLILSAIKEPEC